MSDTAVAHYLSRQPAGWSTPLPVSCLSTGLSISDLDFQGELAGAPVTNLSRELTAKSRSALLVQAKDWHERSTSLKHYSSFSALTTPPNPKLSSQTFCPGLPCSPGKTHKPQNTCSAHCLPSHHLSDPLQTDAPFKQNAKRKLPSQIQNYTFNRLL